MAERTYVAVDLETTGLDSRKDTMIEIGAVRFCGTTVLDRYSTFVDPQRPVPLRVQQITGITDRDVAGAPSLEQVLPELLAFVDVDVHAVVAHNAPFDLGFLQAAGVRFHRPILDTYELSTILLPGVRSYNLGELCRALDIRLPQAHRALADAEATAYLFMRLCERIRELPRPLLQLLVDSGTETAWPPLLLFKDALRGTGHAGVNSTFSEQRTWVRTTDEPDPVVPRLEQIAAEEVVEAYFDPGGALAHQVGEGYERRVGQVQMARLVLNALNSSAHAIVEAGTGTGKSQAYLLPAALWATATGQRVVIATNTITLQDQLIEQEIPRLQRALAEMRPDLPWVRASLLKGRSRYLCLRRLQAWCSGRVLAPTELRMLARVLVWLPETKTGDITELAMHDPQERVLWEQIASDAATCTIERCGTPAPMTLDPIWTTWLHASMLPDFYWTARHRAQEADLLVVNHALLMADLQSGGRLLPEYEYVIVDEAHRLEQAATEQLTYRLEGNQIELIVQGMRLPDETVALFGSVPKWQHLADQVNAQVRRLIPLVHSFVEALMRVALRQPGVHEQQAEQLQRIALDVLRPQPRWSQVEIEWDFISEELRQLAQAGRTLEAELDGARWWQQEPQASALALLRRSCELVEEMDAQLSAVILEQPGKRSDTVSWLDLSTDGLTFCAAPVQVGEVLESQLIQPRRSVIFTGATLRTDEGFEYMQERLGCWNAAAAAIESPFDYRSNVLLYLPGDLPMPDRPGYQSALERAIVEAARAADGRTLVLFTSHAHLRATAEAVRSPLDQLDILLLEHGPGSRGRVLREFRSEKRAVLLGTGTFWEGIDLPGDILSCLLIVRLPFAVPTDPLIAARARAYDDSFHEYTVPDAVLRFRQGFGRLIRHTNDRGVVVLLDSRAWRRPYGSAFLDALPGCTVRHAPLMNLGETVAQWLASEPWPLPDGYDSWPNSLRP